uniref:Uncharacterized protein n=1 Tax=Ciona savignyi TaxID=51511 RepID=H2Z9N8_CIOSA
VAFLYTPNIRFLERRDDRDCVTLFLRRGRGGTGRFCHNTGLQRGIVFYNGYIHNYSLFHILYLHCQIPKTTNRQI